MIHDHRELHDRDVASSVVSRFAQLVDACPDCVAISTAGQCLTYGDLHRASNRVANAILAMHGDDEAPVIVLAKPGATANQGWALLLVPQLRPPPSAWKCGTA